MLSVAFAKSWVKTAAFYELLNIKQLPWIEEGFAFVLYDVKIRFILLETKIDFIVYLVRKFIEIPGLVMSRGGFRDLHEGGKFFFNFKQF